MSRKELKEFLELLHFHGYIDHDITKLENLIDNYYPEQHNKAHAEQSEQLKVEVGALANRLALAGEGNAAVAMHRICNNL